MDTAAFKKQLEESRLVEHVSPTGATFKLRLPTPFAWRVAVDRNRDAKGRTIPALFNRELVDVAVIGWSGLKASLIDSGAGDEEVPFSPAMLAELLDNNDAVRDELTLALFSKDVERTKKREAARKNS